MANVKLKFYGDLQSGCEDISLTAFATVDNLIYIEIEGQYEFSNICLDRATAIMLVKELKKQIGYLEGEK